MSERNQAIEPVIPHTTLNEQLVLSLLDRYIDVTKTSFGELAKKFYEFSPEVLEDLKYHGRQVSFYMKRERSISPNHWFGIAEFVFSDEFRETLPESRIVIRQQESALEAAVYFSKLNGLGSQTETLSEVPDFACGYWVSPGVNREQIYIHKVSGYEFAIVHGLSLLSPVIWSGFLYPGQRNEKGKSKFTPEIQIRDSDCLYDVYLWNRLTREVFIGGTHAFSFDQGEGLIHAGRTLNPGNFEEYLNPEIFGTFDFTVLYKAGKTRKEISDYYTGKILRFPKDTIRESNTRSTENMGLAQISRLVPFINFIDKNLWGVLGDGADR